MEKIPYNERIENIETYKEFFSSSEYFTEKLKAVRQYLRTDRNSELYCDHHRRTPFIVFKYDDDDKVTAQFGYSNLWDVIIHSVPLTGMDNPQPAEGWINYIFHKAKEYINQ